MYDAASPSDPLPDAPVLQRARGALSVSFKRRGAATVLDGLRQDGCLKARFPRVEPHAWATAVTVNTSGGVAGGDRLTFEFGVGEGAHASIAGQAAERFYRSAPDSLPSNVRTRLTIAAGAALEWLPQETILFDRCALDRHLAVDVASDGWFLAVEPLLFGRAAMGERVQRGWLRDLIRIRRGGELVLHDAIRLDGDVDALMRRAAIARGAGTMAILVHVASGAEARLDSVRAALACTPSQVIHEPEPVHDNGPGMRRDERADVVAGNVEFAASAWNGMLLARILAPDGAALRRAVTAALGAVRGSRPLPRVWMC